MKITQLHKILFTNLLVLSTTLGGSFAADDHKGDDLSDASISNKKALFEANRSTITPTNSPLREEKLGANSVIKKLAGKLDGEAELLAKQKVELVQKEADAKIKDIEEQTAIKINKIEGQVAVKQQELSDIVALIESKKTELETMQQEMVRLKLANEELALQIKLKEADAIVTWSGAKAKVASVTSYIPGSSWFSPTKQTTEPKVTDPQ